MAQPGRFRGYPGRLHGNLALLLGEEEAELHDAALRMDASGCHDWAELEKAASKMVESSLELAVRMESAWDIDRLRILDTRAKESITPTFATLPFLSYHSDVQHEFQRLVPRRR